MAATLEYEQLNKNLEIVDGHAVKAPEDYQDPEQLYQALVARIRKYHPSADISMVEKAYRIAKDAHKDQVRKSGEPYIIHPLWVGIILADLEMDKETIVAGMLHDAGRYHPGVRGRGGSSRRRRDEAGTVELLPG